MTSPTILIRHSVPGRVRLQARALRRDAAAAGRLELALGGMDGVLAVRCNLACGSMVIRFDEDRLDRAMVLRRAEDILSDGRHPRPGRLPACASELCSGRACEATRMGCDPVRPATRRFALVSAVMGVVGLRKLLGLAVSGAALSPLGLAAALVSVPLFRQAARQARQKRFTLESFLGAGCMAAVVAGEALTAFEILWIHSGAELLKAWITERSRRSIAGILRLSGHHTFILVDGVEVEAEVDSLRPGDVVVLHTGEKVCVDGEVESGEALLDESPITGRADHVLRKPGDRVLAGTFVRQGVIRVRARDVGDGTYLARILRQVEDSLENRAPIEGVADRLASRLVRLGFLATGATWIFTGSAWRAFSVMLVMACPCATVLAASTAISAAIASAARRNILIKGGRHLEEIGRMDTACFDKTGTLTGMEPVLTRILPLDGTEEEALLRMAVSVEAHNHHPLAQAVKAEAARRGIAATPHSVCDYTLGMGMRAEVGGSVILVGNGRLMERHDVPLADARSRARELRRDGHTVLYMARDAEVLGLLAFDNRIRPESARVLAALRRNGVKRVVLITGDEAGAARGLARKLDIPEHHAALLPEDKAALVRDLRDQGARVLMVGDGINDALALAEADVGVAMGVGGSEAAVEAADIALVDDGLDGLAYVQDLSKKTLRVVRQNFWIATGSNLAGVALGAAGLLSPVAAGLLHIVHSLGVLANSSRLLRAQSLPPMIEEKP